VCFGGFLLYFLQFHDFSWLVHIGQICILPRTHLVCGNVHTFISILGLSFVRTCHLFDDIFGTVLLPFTVRSLAFRL
jgi:hypothetical protein